METMRLEELADARDKAGDLIERDWIRAAIEERDAARHASLIDQGSILHWQERAEKAEAERDAALAANRDCVDHFEQMRAELAALNKRIEDAPVCAIGNLHLFEYHAPFIGKRVRLLVEGDDV